MHSKIAPLTVDWTFREPPVTPRSWWHFSAAKTAASPSGEMAADRALEERLGLAPKSLATLKAAFAEKLGRAVGWTSPSPEDHAALRDGARLYKRGVGFADHPGPSAQVQRHGRYLLTITSEAPDLERFVADDFLVVDGRVARAWPDLSRLRDAVVLALDEHSKSLASVATILDAWRRLGRPASWTVVGGGLLSDVAAFAAGLAEASIRFVPTTLLAMADACVGGKSGVNFPPYGKNQLGLFHFPRQVDVWTGWLATLPPRELAAGMAECLKHCMLAGDVELATQLVHAAQEQNLLALAELIGAVIAIKAHVVARDPAEVGERASLNLGHSLAHVVEALSQERTSGAATIIHGEAVSVGLIYALFVSERCAALAPSEAAIMRGWLTQAAIIPKTQTLAAALGVKSLDDETLFAELFQRMEHDKKNEAARAEVGTEKRRFVLLASLGRTARHDDGSFTLPVERAMLELAWQDLRRFMQEAD